MKYKVLFLLLLSSLGMQQVWAQGARVRNNYAWAIGAQTGATSYYGDMNYKFMPSNRYDLTHFDKNYDSRTFGIHVDKRLSNALSLSFAGNYGNVTGNDRTIGSGNKLVTENTNVRRSLNFRSEYYDLGASLVYNFANGFLIRNNARFSPYIGIGVGVTSFSVFGDLYTSDGNRYYYWNDGSIRNLSEYDPNAASAVTVKQDRQYETRLSSFKIEGVDYPQIVLNVPVTLGVKYRLADRWDLSLNASARYLFTDYFDDVAGVYPSTRLTSQEAYILNPNDQVVVNAGANRGTTMKNKYLTNNDIYSSVTIGISHRFGMQLRKFKGPRYYSQEVKREAPKPVAPVPTTNEKGVVINVNNNEQINVMEKQMKEMQELLSSSTADQKQEVQKLSDELAALKTEQTRLENMSSQPVNDNAEITERRALLEMRMDSVREVEIVASENKLEELEARIARMENSKTDTVGLSGLKKEREVVKKKREKLRRQKKSKDSELKSMQQKMDEMAAKIDAIEVRPAKTDDVEVNRLRREVDMLRDEIGRVRNSQQPVQIYNSTPQPQIVPQPVAPQQPIIISQPANNGNMDATNQTLLQINRNLESISTRLLALETKQPTVITQPAAPAPAPIIVQQPAAPAPVNYTTVKNVGLTKVSVFFANGTTQILTKHIKALSNLVAEAKKDTYLRINLTGFASANGNAETNQRLSQQRADNVRNYLISQGIAADRVSIQAFGETMSSSSDESERRVDVELMGY